MEIENQNELPSSPAMGNPGLRSQLGGSIGSGSHISRTSQLIPLNLFLLESSLKWFGF